MADGNGFSSTGMTVPIMAPTETSPFKIGGQTIKVPALTLFTLERVKTKIIDLSPNLDWISYAANVIEIVSEAVKESRPDLTVEALKKACSIAEMRELASSFNKLLEVSGFLMGENQAAGESPGTGTLTPSSPTLQPGESAVETSAG